MSTEFDSLQDCTLGGSGFQLDDYAYKEEAIVEEGKGKTGATISVEGEGYVVGGDPSTLSAAIASAVAGFRVSGQDFTIFGPAATPELVVAAATCVDGGPHVSFELLKNKDGDSSTRRFKFTLSAKTSGKTSDHDPAETYKVKSSVRPDGLREISISGELTGGAASAFYSASVLPRWTALYPTPRWVPVTSFDDNATDDKATYTLTFKELAVPMPDGAAAGVVRAVDGDFEDGFDYDEQMRKTRRLAYDFIVVGDPMALRDLMRNAFGDIPLRERYEVSHHQETRVRGEIQSLGGANGNILMNWTRGVHCVVQQTDTYEAHAVPGAQPIYVKVPLKGFVYEDAGEAIGAGAFPKPPDPLFTSFGAPHDITFSDQNATEKKTSWRYTYLLETAIEFTAAILRKFERPNQPAFYENAPAT